ncbi:hypothetical protein AVEN_119738-1 [Araneus ventricosus]|uniref:TIL-like domain-containing protein n=1 Tax=Araneus ventricosus TaxID=182803 RepID=A0A4Y2TY87_ARAVE|nr:hypothetical protein AVEN_119738-1 [Araneus ventricosus]
MLSSKWKQTREKEKKIFKTKCDCGPNGMCSLKNDLQICDCEQGFRVKDGRCTECDCGPYGICSFENGLKKCSCEQGHTVKDGKCKECDCGPNGSCSFEYGVMKCNCEQGFVSTDGKCTGNHKRVTPTNFSLRIKYEWSYSRDKNQALCPRFIDPITSSSCDDPSERGTTRHRKRKTRAHTLICLLIW